MRFSYQNHRWDQSSLRPSLFTDAIKLIISINFLIFILQYFSGIEDKLFPIFGIVPSKTFGELMLWQPFTYLFFHGGIWHVLINMFVLWMFGSELEKYWGKREFLRFFFVTGVGSGLVTVLFSLSSSTPVVGASGAIYGVLLAYGLMFPNRLVYLYFLIPIKVKYLVILIGTIAFFSSLNPGYSNISHLTHLSGMIIGFVYFRSNLNWNTINHFVIHRKNEIKRHYKDKKNEKREALKLKVDAVLDKINEKGYDSLSKSEREFLFTASKKLSQEEDKN
ncbi:MAG: rhomboid family intramembrane serine protease [Candidatus Marinimicrobia bacterium]|nr:rhomboid family intramembrane serine protease [Candidatus Neomarinimicrobiota bacterium]MDP7025608.1 rhomboid family intramembrane serine protease [Candidatus Neomarinimicrobiota bacterium]